MGLSLSKRHKKVKKSATKAAEVSDDDGLTVFSEDMYDQQMIRHLKNEFNNNMDLFLLNQLLMSVMFFENYDDEILKLPHKKGNQSLNPTLLKEYQKSCIKPDAVAEIVNKHVQFRIHGPDENKIEALLPRRMFIIHDNIEIGTEDENHYSGIDNPTYKAKMVNSQKKGYVKLQHIKEEEREKSSSSDSGSDDETVDSDSSTEGNDTLVIPQQDLYDYGRINEARTPKPLSSVGSSSSVPKNFVRTILVQNLRSADDDDEYDEKKDAEEEGHDDLYRTEHFLDSEALMTFFRKSCFKKTLGPALGFTPKDLESSTYTTTSIYCNAEGEENIINWEIIPAVIICWPEYQTFEWYKRTDRETVMDRTQKSYQWPSNYMINEIKNMNCVVIPRGYLPKRGTNKEHHLEWEIGLPAAEKYLEAKMAHAHMRSYLFLVTLYKTFLEPETKKQGILIDHLKSHMFWEIEKNPITWPENKLGTKILKVLGHLYESLGKHHLPDYFIRDKNLFENIPNYQLWKAQEILNQVIQAPVMHFLSALRNLQYTSSEFYSPPDLRRLYGILTSSSGLEETNPSLFAATISDPPQRPQHQVKQLDPQREWERRKAEIEARKRLKEKEKQNTKGIEEAQKPKDTINLRWTSKKFLDIDPSRDRSILMFFLDHFLRIVKESIKRGAYMQASLYLQQAYYLTKILQETLANEQDVQKYSEDIKDLRFEIHKNGDRTDNPPETPSRNSFYVPQNIVINSNNILDVRKLQDSHKSGYVKETTVMRPKSLVQSPDVTKLAKQGASLSPKSVAFDTVNIAISEI